MEHVLPKYVITVKHVFLLLCIPHILTGLLYDTIQTVVVVVM